MLGATRAINEMGSIAEYINLPLKGSNSGKHGSLVVSALAFNARGHGFDPCDRSGKV